MTTKKDPKNIKGGTGSAGQESVGASSLGFDPESGIPPTIFLDELIVSDIQVSELDANTITSTNGTFDSFTVNDLTVTTSLISGGTATFNDGLETNEISDVSGGTVAFTSDDVEMSILKTSDRVQSNVLAPLTGTSVTVEATELEMQGDLDVTGITKTNQINPHDGNIVSFGDFSLEDIEEVTAVKGNFDVLDSNLENEITVNTDIVGSGSVEGIKFSQSLQRFTGLTEAFEALDVGQAGVVETYDNSQQRFGSRRTQSWPSLANADVEAMTTDGRFIYAFTDDRQAVGIDRDTATIEQIYTNIDADVGNVKKVTTNGRFVAFAYDHYVNIFEVDYNGGGSSFNPVISYETPAEGEILDIWMSHDVVVVSSEQSLDKIPLDGSPVDQQGNPGLEVITGYGNYLIAILGGGGIQLYDIEVGVDQVGAGLPLPTSSASDLVTDGSYVYVGNPLGTGGEEVYALQLDVDEGFNTTTTPVWSYSEGGDNTRLAVDHRNLYVINNLDRLTLFDKKSFTKKHVLDGPVSGDGVDWPTEVRDIVSDGEDFFLAGTHGESINRFYGDQDPSIFYKVDPDNRRGKLFSHHMIPSQNKTSSLRDEYKATRFEATQDVTAETVEASDKVTAEMEVLAPNVPVASGKIRDSDGNLSSPYNIESVTRSGTGATDGQYTITFPDGIVENNQVIQLSLLADETDDTVGIRVIHSSTINNIITVQTYDSGGNELVDFNHFFITVYPQVS